MPKTVQYHICGSCIPPQHVTLVSDRQLEHDDIGVYAMLLFCRTTLISK